MLTSDTITDEQIRRLRDQAIAYGYDTDTAYVCTFALGETPCRACGRLHVSESDCPAFWEHHHRVLRCRGICADTLNARNAILNQRKPHGI